MDLSLPATRQATVMITVVITVIKRHENPRSDVGAGPALAMTVYAADAAQNAPYASMAPNHRWVQINR
jgi:hypothetical protein